jgi:hypothetical protein
MSVFKGWRPALRWGISVALLHRLILGVWMALIWLMIDPFTDYPPDFKATTENHLPDLGSPAARIIFGVWRRWDAVHYLDIAEFGYRIENPGPSVFGPLTPYSFRAVGWLLPGPADVGAMVVETGALALALVLLFRLVEGDYGDPALARWSVGIMALLPLSYFLAAPMSEAPYLALALGLVYASFRRRWGWAALCGILATLARTQGVMLMGVAALILLRHQTTGQVPSPTRLERGFRGEAKRAWAALREGWPLLTIPSGVALFYALRAAYDLPPLNDIYRTESYIFFTDPIHALYYNLRHFVTHLPGSLIETDLIALFLVFGLAVWMLRDPVHGWRRNWPLVVYTWGYALIFLCKVNWQHKTDHITFTQSFARYALALFPLTIFFADRLRSLAPGRRRAALISLVVLALIFSARHVLYLAGP